MEDCHEEDRIQGVPRSDRRLYRIGRRAGHHGYANDIALPTLKEGGNYKEGAEIACSFHELETKDGGTTQGKKIKVGLMKKDAKATKTDGWTYSALGPDGMPKEIDPVKACFECHKKAKDTDYIFSRYID
jgi:hypothetical protein